MKRLKERDAENYRATEDKLMDFFDFLNCGGQEGEKCDFYQADLPCEAPGNRICRDFAPNDRYYADNPIHQVDGATQRYFEAEARFGWFGIELEPGVLYEFPYHQPEQIQKLKRLDDQTKRPDLP